MPNYVTNVLQIRSKNKSQLEYIVSDNIVKGTDANGNESLEFDFNKIIPRPAKYEKTISPVGAGGVGFLYGYNNVDLVGTYVRSAILGDDAPISVHRNDHLTVGEVIKGMNEKTNNTTLLNTLLDEKVIDLSMLLPEARKRVREKYADEQRRNQYAHTTIEYLDAMENSLNLKEQYGYYTWYDWATSNWGTKWNNPYTNYKLIDEAEIDDSDEHLLIIRMDTAWSCPQPVIIALAQKYQLPIIGHAVDEMGNFAFDFEVTPEEDGHYRWEDTEWTEEKMEKYFGIGEDDIEIEITEPVEVKTIQ